MTKFVIEAKEDAKAGIIKTIVVDPLSDFADMLLRECFKATLTRDGSEDGRRAYPMFADRLKHIVGLLFTIPAHVIVISHYIETGGETIDGSLEKTGEGIVPLIPGKSRALIAAKFHDVIWMDINRAPTPTLQRGQRVFITSPRGAWGPGCRSLSQEGSHILPADIGELLKAFAAQTKTVARGVNGAKPPTRPMVPPKPMARPQPTKKL